MSLKEKHKAKVDENEKSHLKNGINRKKIVLNNIIQLASATLIFILINYLSFSDYKRWDLSKTKKFSVSEETSNYLKEQLDQKVIITMAFLKSSKIRNQLKLL